MTDFTKTIMLAAAVLMVAGVASAQPIKADVPFAFWAGDKLMSPGTYIVDTVNPTSGIEVFQLRNLGERSAVMALPANKKDAGRDWQADGKPRLAFDCGESVCSLAEIWRGSTSRTSYGFHRPKAHREAHTRMAVIVAQPAKGE